MFSTESEPIRVLDRPLAAHNRLAEGDAISPQVLDRAMARGRRLRSEAFLRFVTRLARSVLKLAKRTREAHRRWREVRHTERALRSLDAHLRRDIGIDGHQIPALARGLANQSTVAPRSGAQVCALPVRNCGGVERDDRCVERAA